MSCVLTGNLMKLSVIVEHGETHCYGDVDDITFYSGGNETPPKMPCHMSLYCQPSRAMKGALSLKTVVGALDAKLIESFDTFKSCVTLMAYDASHREAFYGVSIMVPQDDFDAFSRFAQLHLGRGLQYHVTTPYFGFSGGKDGRPPTLIGSCSCGRQRFAVIGATMSFLHQRTSLLGHPLCAFARAPRLHHRPNLLSSTAGARAHSNRVHANVTTKKIALAAKRLGAKS